MKKLATLCTSVALVAGLTLGMTACTPGNNVPGATAAGAVAGGLLGAAVVPGSGQVLGIVGGALVGAVIGNQIGQYMDRRDYDNVQYVVVHDAPRTWTNERTHYTYTVTPVKRYHYHGRLCREYRTTAIIGGRTRVVYGRACRMPDGAWRAVG